MKLTDTLPTIFFIVVGAAILFAAAVPSSAASVNELEESQQQKEYSKLRRFLSGKHHQGVNHIQGAEEDKKTNDGFHKVSAEEVSDTAVPAEYQVAQFTTTANYQGDICPDPKQYTLYVESIDRFRLYRRFGAHIGTCSNDCTFCLLCGVSYDIIVEATSPQADLDAWWNDVELHPWISNPSFGPESSFAYFIVDCPEIGPLGYAEFHENKEQQEP